MKGIFYRKVVKRMKKFRRNEKGTVLLTVLCFTTMCLVIAAIALRVSNRSNAQSTDNVMKAQAQITAEHYLEQYLDTFEDVVGSNGAVRKNYDPLKTIAGPNETSPTKITIAVKQKEGAMSQVNISDGTLEQTAVYGGNCTIYVYKDSSGGIVVKADASYGEQSSVASAYFYGQAPATSLNKNAIETCGGYDVSNTACVSGDILLSNDNPDIVTKFKNNNGVYQSNFKTNGNLSNNPENVKFGDTLQGNAPTITAEGFMYFTQLVIKTDVGKTDANGKHATDSGYDPSNLLNKNGYLNCQYKIFLNQSANEIGSNNRPIDIYCSGLTVGLMPSTAYGNYSDADVSGFKTSIETTFGQTTMSNNSGDMKIYGNVYCSKHPTKSNEIIGDGDLIVNTQNSLNIHGDVVVDGNIYINGANLTVDGNVYCTGNYDASKINLTSGHSISTTLPANQRAQKPSMNYSPGLYEYGVLDNPEITDPQNYKSQTPAHMYAQNDEKTKYFQNNFLSALEYKLGDSVGSNPVSSGYPGNDSNLSGKEITIYKSCRLTPAQVLSDKTTSNPVKYKIEVTTTDVWILLPAITNDGITINAQFMVNNPNNGHHCYFVFYQYDPVKDANNDYTSDDTAVKAAAKNSAAAYYKNGTGSGYDAEVTFMPYACHREGCLFTKSFMDSFSDQTPDNQDAKTNIVVLVPDDFQINLTKRGGGFFNTFHAVFFGPYADLNPNTNEGTIVYGQDKVDNYITDEASQLKQNARFCDLADDSILHTFLTQAPTTGGIINLQYFIKHK